MVGCIETLSVLRGKVLGWQCACPVLTKIAASTSIGIRLQAQLPTEHPVLTLISAANVPCRSCKTVQDQTALPCPQLPRSKLCLSKCPCCFGCINRCQLPTLHELHTPGVCDLRPCAIALPVVPARTPVAMDCTTICVFLRLQPCSVTFSPEALLQLLHTLGSITRIRDWRCCCRCSSRLLKGTPADLSRDNTTLTGYWQVICCWYREPRALPWQLLLHCILANIHSDKGASRSCS